MKREAKKSRTGFAFLEREQARGIVRVIDEADLTNTRHEFPDQFQPLTLGVGMLCRDPGNISTRTSQACDKARRDRIADTDKHDGDRARYGSRHSRGGSPASEQDVHGQSN